MSTATLSMTPDQVVSIARDDCRRLFGRVKWQVRATPVDQEQWDGITWSLRQLASKGLPRRRYRADAYKPGGELPIATYEIVMPHQHFSAGIVFRETIKVEAGLTVFEFEEVPSHRNTHNPQPETS